MKCSTQIFCKIQVLRFVVMRETYASTSTVMQSSTFSAALDPPSSTPEVASVFSLVAVSVHFALNHPTNLLTDSPGAAVWMRSARLLKPACCVWSMVDFSYGHKQGKMYNMRKISIEICSLYISSVVNAAYSCHQTNHCNFDWIFQHGGTSGLR